MPIPIQCPQCGRRFQIADAFAGRSAKCPCGSRVPVPAADAEAIAATPATAVVGASSADAAAKPRVVGSPPAARAESSRPNRGAEVAASGMRAALQIGGAAVVGAGLAYSRAVGRGVNVDGLSPVFITLMGAAFGAIAGAILTCADWVRKRRDAGGRVPWPLVLLFARGWLSLVLWFVGAIVLTLAVTMLTLGM